MPVVIKRGEVGRCQRCPAPIAWARTTAGKAMPMDPEPDPAGNLAVYRDAAGRLVCRVVSAELPAAGYETIFMPHWATCAPPAPLPRQRRPVPHRRPTKGPTVSNYATTAVIRNGEEVDAEVARDLLEPDLGRVRVTIDDSNSNVDIVLDRDSAVELAIAILEATEPQLIGPDRLNADLLTLGSAFLAFRSNAGRDLRVERIHPDRVIITDR